MVVAFPLSDGRLPVVLLYPIHLCLRLGYDLGLLPGHLEVAYTEGETCLGAFLKTQVLDTVQEFNGPLPTQVSVAIVDDTVQALLVQVVIIKGQFVWKDIVEYNPPYSSLE